jgi:hypothetical protein
MIALKRMIIVRVARNYDTPRSIHITSPLPNNKNSNTKPKSLGTPNRSNPINPSPPLNSPNEPMTSTSQACGFRINPGSRLRLPLNQIELTEPRCHLGFTQFPRQHPTPRACLSVCLYLCCLSVCRREEEEAEIWRPNLSACLPVSMPVCLLACLCP